MAAEVLKEVLEAAIDAARPHVARWWNEQARPAIWSAAKATRNRFGRASSNAQDDAGIVPSGAPSTKQCPQGVHTEPADGTVMTMREAEQRLAAALVARAFSDEQVRMILNSRVVDDAGQDVRLSLQEVPPAEIEAQVRQLLNDNRFMLGRLMDVLAETPPDHDFSLLRLSAPSSGLREHARRLIDKRAMRRFGREAALTRNHRCALALDEANPLCREIHAVHAPTLVQPRTSLDMTPFTLIGPPRAVAASRRR